MNRAIATMAITSPAASGGLRPMWSESRPVTRSPPITPTPYTAKTIVIVSDERPNWDS